MAVFQKFIKFFIFKEAIPYKRQDYVDQILDLRKDIQEARLENDQKSLWQFRCLYAIIGVFIAHFVHLYMADLSQIESYIQIDVFGWVGLYRTLNLCFALFYLVVIYYLHVVFCSNNLNPAIKWVTEMSNGQQLSLQHWPYRYKNHNSMALVRRVFFKTMNVMQIILISLGK